MEVLFVLLTLIYFLPALIAALRKHSNQNSIALLNVLLGWTLAGWIVALIWSFSDNVKDRPPQAAQPEIPLAIGEEALSDNKTCLQCAETIKKAAILCRFCGANLAK